MQALARDVLKDIEILKLKMQLQQNEDLLAQLKGKDELDLGRLIYAYGLKEYLEIKQKFLLEGRDITEQEAAFADTFALFLDNRIPDSGNGAIQKRFLRGYLTEKYAAQINQLIPPDLEAVIAALESQLSAEAEDGTAREDARPQGVMPELECLSLSGEPSRFLYSLELLKIEYDIRSAKSDQERSAKAAWRNEWQQGILRGLGKEGRAPAYFIRDAQELYTQMRDAYDRSSQKSWYYLVAYEAALFVPYFPLDADRKSSKLWKHLSLRGDYMSEEFCHHQMVVDSALLRKMIQTFNRNIGRLSGQPAKVAMAVAATSVAAVASGGLASFFAPSIAVMLAGGNVAAGLSGAALVNASLAFIGGGSLAAGGLGVAGGTAVITGGGALLGMLGSGASAVSAMVLLSTEGYSLRECAKLLSFAKVVLVDEFGMYSTVSLIQKAVEKRIGEFGAQLAVLKATPKASKKMIRSIEASMDYLSKCNKELLKLSDAEKSPAGQASPIARVLPKKFPRFPRKDRSQRG